MSVLDAAPVTIPTRTKPIDVWQVGDIVTVGATRWKFRAISRAGKAVLSSMNTSNVEVWWDTTLDLLPKRGA
ncbi:hypothetical protein [Microbacterium oleivorans]|uniref:Uncharacterized protein n=1 Tax=Microbacterium oleivorans TaxID=273677 RepID=A0A7D5IV46_9MICO|nr:hypothetical protein [Microbacterium oleivorans]QLD10922.1 hypothetical protein HW566_03445 [Microbacterium oleivorans]